jgi:hypothetical protein
MAFTVDIRGNASHLEKTLKSMKGSIASLGSVATAGVGALTALGAAGAAGIGAFVASSSKAASDVESLTMQFTTLLGSTDAAGKRMKEIVDFAASTPFEVAELSSTSKLLQTLGGDLLATGEGLRMVGDAAAISGQPLEEVGLHIGRIFNAITSGTSAGESVNRLQELGLITGTVKREFEDLAEAQKKGKAATLTSEQALGKLKGILAQTNGAMQRLASTTEGMKSNLADNITKLQVAFGTGFNEGFRDVLTAANNFLPQLEGKFAEAGTIVGNALSEAVTGNTERLAAIGAFIGEAVFEGFKAFYLKAMDELVAGGQNIVTGDRSDPTGLIRLGEFAAGKMGIDPSRLGLPDRNKIIKGQGTASNASYLQTAMENLKNSETLRTISQPSSLQSAEARALPKTFNAMMKYLQEISDNTEMRSPVGARFSN